jgi:hypothetical protein
MRVTIDVEGDAMISSVEIVLSRRNLLALLQKLDMEGSARTIIGWDTSGDVPISVRSENDAEHYVGRKPGPMHSATEKFIAGR